MYKLLAIALSFGVMTLCGFIHGHRVPGRELMLPLPVDRLNALMADEQTAKRYIAQVTIHSGKRIESVKLTDSREYRVVAPESFCFDSLIDKATGEYGIECTDTCDCGRF
jgi:hypothetical protein